MGGHKSKQKECSDCDQTQYGKFIDLAINMKSFTYINACSIEEAVTLLGERKPDALPIAGGTDLIVQMKRGLIAPKVLIDISGIEKLHGIRNDEQGLYIGSMVTHAEIAASPVVQISIPAVSAASASVGAPQTRNLGTLGGSLASCMPSMDAAPCLLALEAVARLTGKNGERVIPIEQFFLGPRRSALAKDELLVEIMIPAKNLTEACSFEKFGRRKALTLALVNAAASVKLDKKTGKFEYARLSLGAVAPTPIRARETEIFLMQKAANEQTIGQAARLAAEEAKPINDFRASADYRRALIKVLVKRVLTDAASKASNG